MGKTYIVYYEWPNTAGNHAGMAYLFRSLKQRNTDTVRLIKMPTNINKWNKRIQRMYMYLMVLFLYFVVGSKNSIFFTEFLGNNSGNQTRMAHLLKKLNPTTKLYGLVHLSEKHLLELYGNDKYIISSLEVIDKVVVLGSSLGKYFDRLGFSDKVVVTFHYVDTSYYKPNPNKPKTSNLNVIAMGSLKRNHKELRDIITATPDIMYDVCMGNTDLTAIFAGMRNVVLHGFLSEDELLSLMQQADISISVLEDTVGSNVITTSLACGLAQVVSDVGSIRDYCDETNSFLCKNKEAFIDAMYLLAENTNLREQMSTSAFIKAEKINIEIFNNWFRANIINEY